MGHFLLYETVSTPTQDFSQFTQEKHKNVVNLIIRYNAVRQSNLKWLKIFSFYLNLFMEEE